MELVWYLKGFVFAMKLFLWVEGVFWKGKLWALKDEKGSGFWMELVKILG